MRCKQRNDAKHSECKPRKRMPAKKNKTLHIYDSLQQKSSNPAGGALCATVHLMIESMFLCLAACFLFFFFVCTTTLLKYLVQAQVRIREFASCRYRQRRRISRLCLSFALSFVGHRRRRCSNRFRRDARCDDAACGRKIGSSAKPT